MKGDFTRNTFHPEKHYSGVLMQQGRVQVDADWNEQQAISRYRIETEALDVIGACGAPEDNAGFGISPTPDGSDLIISPGRIYVDGILCELEAETTYLTQPDYPNPPALQFLSSTEGPSPLETRTDKGENGWISFERTVPASVAVGVPFQVTVRITAQTELAAATVDDQLSAGLTLEDGSLRASAGALSAGDSFTNTYTVKATAPGTISGLAVPILDVVTMLPPRVSLDSVVNVVSASPGPYLVYLDVWRRHLTALDDPLIREVALGGPDTATRVKTLWQVKLWPIAGGASCKQWPEGWDELPISDGTLNARTQEVADEDDPCLLPPTAGYKRLENQLYRVEIHDGGALGEATFKWSRDNGTVVTAIEGISGSDITVQDLGRDEVLGFAPGQWVEISDDVLELHGEPGMLFQIEDVNPATRVITLDVDPLGPDPSANMTHYPKLRRWDSQGPMTVEVPAGNDGWIELEGGIEVQFSPGTYKSGDYWLIPARTATGEIEWPPYEPGADPVAQPPLGIEHHYCRLALVNLQGGTEDRTLIGIDEDGNFTPDLAESWEISEDSTTWTFHLVENVTMPDGTPFTAEAVKVILEAYGYEFEAIDDYTVRVWGLTEDLLKELSEIPIIEGSEEPAVTDCRHIFPPLTRITSGGGHGEYLALRYVGGDGQEGRPGETLPCTLAVGVEDENGRPVPGVQVTFSVGESCGSLLNLATGAGSGEITVPSDSRGIAEVGWTLGQEMKVGQCCRAIARLAQAPQREALEIHFKATARQDDEERDWPQIKEISWRNDQPMPLGEFNEKGLWVVFNQAMDPPTITLDTFIVTLELPTIEPPALQVEGLDTQVAAIKEGMAYPGHRIFIVPGKFERNELAWRFIPQNLPEEVLGTWLTSQEMFFPELIDLEGLHIRCRVLLKGNAILSAEGGEPLDGEAFGTPAEDDNGNRFTDLDLPSGDGCKGGDFESWFYLVE